MKRWLATLLVFTFCSAIVRADVTIVQTTTVEGGMAAAAGQGASPRITTRIKGLKSRTDMELPTGSVSTITDVTTKQVIILNHAQKTAQMGGGAPATATSTTPPLTGTVTMDASVTPTGKSQVIDGLKCDEFTFTTKMAMSDIGGAGVPPEAAAMMAGMSMVMSGSMWVTKDAPGAAEYLGYQKAMSAADLSGAAMAATGVKMPGMDKLAKAMASVNGLAYMTEMNMTIEGTGQMADMMRQMGAMKITTKSSSISVDPIGDDQFKVPEGYTVIK